MPKLPDSSVRLDTNQIARLKRVARELAGAQARLYLFGSRTDDRARGGDVDLLVDLPRPATEPALLAARIAARCSRALDGRKVDVILAAPNLARQPIHEVAFRDGVPL